MSIPLTKKAGVGDWLEMGKDAIWDDERGPFENIFKLAENGLILFGGPVKAAILVVAKATGFDLAAIGRHIDQTNGFTSISDLLGMNPESVAAGATKDIEDEPQESEADSYFGSPIRSSEELPWLQKTAAGYKFRRGIGWGKKGLLVGAFAMIARGISRMIADPASTLSKVLRSAGIIGSEQFEKSHSDLNLGMEKQLKISPAKSPKQQLEATVDQILGE